MLFLKAITSGHANLPTFISPGQQLIASYTQDAFASGSRERIGPQLYYHSGPLRIMSEYTISQQKIKIRTTSDKVANDAFQVQISWIIFNGDASFRRVQPGNIWKSQCSRRHTISHTILSNLTFTPRPLRMACLTRIVQSAELRILG